MRSGLSSLFLVLVPLFGKAADSLSLPPIHPSIITSYDIEPGIPLSSYANLLYDDDGRLWVNPLPAKGQAPMDFYQFDGYRSYLKAHSDSSYTALGEQTILKGVMEDGSLLGFAEHTNQFFFFDPDHSTFEYYSIGQQEEVENLLIDNDGQLYILARAAGYFIVYAFQKGETEVLLKHEIEAEDSSIRVLIDHGMIFDGALYFVETKKKLPLGELLSVNLFRLLLHDHGVERFDLTAHFIENWTLEVTERFFLLSMAADHENNLLLSFFLFEELFLFDTKTKQFKPHTKYNQYLSVRDIKAEQIEIFSDEKQNLIIKTFKGFSANENGSLIKKFDYILIDQSGKFYDYNPVMSEVINASKYHTVEVHDIYGTDFKRHAYFSLRGEFLVANIQQRSGVRRLFEGFPLRAIAQIDQEQCLAVFDNKVATVVNINSGKSFEMSSYPSCSYKDGLNLFCQINKDEDGNTWFPIWDRLVRFDQSKNGCDQFMVGTAFLKFDFITDHLVILVDDKKGLVYTFDLKQQILHPFPSPEAHLKLDGFVNDCFVSTSGMAWIATDQGAWRIDYTAQQFQKLKLNNGAQNERVLCINEDEAGRIWFGVFNGGVHIFDPVSEEVTVVDNHNGLSDNTVVGLLVDDDQYKWVSTFDGINVLSPAGKVLGFLSEENGLSANEFNRYSAHKSDNGQLMFGSISGLNILDPEVIKANILKEDSLFIYPTSLSYFDETLEAEFVQTTSFDFKQEIILPADHRYLILEFALTDYSLPTESTYAYKIEKQSGQTGSYSGDWIDIGANSTLTLNNLPVGDYHIFVSGTDYKGNKALNQIVVPIRVKEFFYKTWWFYSLCSLPFLV